MMQLKETSLLVILLPSHSVTVLVEYHFLFVWLTLVTCKKIFNLILRVL